MKFGVTINYGNWAVPDKIRWQGRTNWAILRHGMPPHGATTGPRVTPERSAMARIADSEARVAELIAGERERARQGLSALARSATPDIAALARRAP